MIRSQTDHAEAEEEKAAMGSQDRAPTHCAPSITDIGSVGPQMPFLTATHTLPFKRVILCLMGLLIGIARYGHTPIPGLSEMVIYVT